MIEIHHGKFAVVLFRLDGERADDAPATHVPTHGSTSALVTATGLLPAQDRRRPDGAVRRDRAPARRRDRVASAGGPAAKNGKAKEPPQEARD
jgi:hypothetical protein